MSLAPGTRLGPYEVLDALGAGGMGEVYRARDTRLNRDVAIKILPEAFAHDADRLARFQREAMTLASLSHPNIAIIHGLEHAGAVHALVMELVPGEDLSKLIARGPMPLDEALVIAKQIAAALEAAHEQGIVHRDLKPANIKVRPDGTVKVLDFGLAKAVDPEAGDTSNSPTMTSPAMTGRGVILGTAGYMSPEQAKGRTVDKRADIFAFGVVFYEMLAGRPLFEGETVSELLASVLKEDPSLERVPAKIRPLLKRCLEKDPKKRLRDIGDAWLLLDERDPAPAAAERRWIPWVAAGIATVIALVSLAALWSMRRALSAPGRVVEFHIDVPPGMVFSPPQMASISPDGEWVVFGARGSSSSPGNLWIRGVRSVAARPLEGTNGAGAPFWSFDNRSIVFAAGGKLKRLELAGGSPAALCDSSSSSGAWNSAGVILFSGTDGLYRVPATGGQPVRVTTVDSSAGETDHSLPQFLPDGNRFLYFVHSEDSNTRGLYAGALDKPAARARILGTDSKAEYVPPRAGKPGVLLFVRGSTLVAQNFDATSLRLGGDTALVAEGLVVNRFGGSSFGQAPFWSSAAGVLLYRRGTLSYDVNWIDRDGRRSDSGMPQGNYSDLRLSPDGTRVAIGRVQEGLSNVWQWEFSRRSWTRLSVAERYDNFPMWSGDGRQVAFSSTITDQSILYRKLIDGSGEADKILESDTLMTPDDWSSDGRYIVYRQAKPNGVGSDAWVVPLDLASRTPAALLRTPFSVAGSKFSPVGKWIAYRSNESGRNEVYVQAFVETSPGTLAPAGRRWPVSQNGGSHVLWRRDGRELFFIASDRTLMAAEISLGPQGAIVGAVRPLFTARFMTLNVQPYDVTADGGRFLVLEAKDVGLHPPFTVVVNWQDALKD